MIWPLKEIRITQYFGENPRIYKKFGLKAHNGLDFSCPVGTDIYCLDDGIIYETGDQGNKGYGKFVRVNLDSKFQAVFAHCSVILVKFNQKVKAGQIIAKSGNSGFSTGPHLHLGIRPNPWEYNNGFAGYIDPKPFLTLTIDKFMQLEQDVQLLKQQLGEIKKAFQIDNLYMRASDGSLWWKDAEGKVYAGATALAILYRLLNRRMMTEEQFKQMKNVLTKIKDERELLKVVKSIKQ